jgi:hypothetical protein
LYERISIRRSISGSCHVNSADTEGAPRDDRAPPPPNIAHSALPYRSLDEWQQSRVFERGDSVADSSHVFRIRRECNKVADAALPHQHRRIPSFFGWADQEVSTATEENQVTAALPEVRKRMFDVEIVGRCAAYRRLRGELWKGRIVGMVPESKQVQHDHFTGNLARHERPA